MYGMQLPDPTVLMSLAGRSMMLTQDWSNHEVETLLRVAAAMEMMDRAGQRLDIFKAELAYAMFFDNSTRTRSAWAGAAARLGMHPVIVDGSSTQVSHGETASETGAMLGMNAHALGVRHDLILGEGNSFMRDVLEGITTYLQANGEERRVPVVNLQCDIDHPTQTLADLLWLRQRFPDGLAGKKVGMSWAYSPSYAKPLSVPQGIVSLMSRQGAEVVLAHPEGYRLMDGPMDAAAANAAASGGSFRVTNDMDEAFSGAVAVYPKSWGPWDLMWDRVEANRRKDPAAMNTIEQEALARNASHRDWICDERRMAMTEGGEGIYMHCLPADIGAEVTPGVMERFKVHVAQEAQKKVYVVMALLAVAKNPGSVARLLEER